MLKALKGDKEAVENLYDESSDPSSSACLKYLEDRKIDLGFQATLSVEAANSIMTRLRAQLEPFRYISDESTPWEEKSSASRLINKAQKSKRNKLWRKRKRKRTAEMLAKVALSCLFPLALIFSSSLFGNIC